MPRRALTLAVSGGLLAVLAAAGSVLPVPYVELQPGPVTDTLGRASNGSEALITVSGHQTYPTSGSIALTTVQVVGDPNHQPTLFSAISGWIAHDTAVVPQQLLFPPGADVGQVEEQNTLDMEQSQDEAITAALRYLHLSAVPHVVVADLVSDAPAASVLKVGDVVLAVDGQDVATKEALQRLITRHQPGEQVRLTIRRDGRTSTVTPKTIASTEGGTRHAIVGFTPAIRHDFPFTVRIHLADVGGPSAGLAFALGLVDKLTPGALTGGRHVAVTGTIDGSGDVGPVGGVQQKVLGAARSGATVFLVPKDECTDARRTAPSSIRLVPVQTLGGAIKALEDLGSNPGRVPAC